MTKATKKIERKIKKIKKRQAEKDLKEKVDMFSKLEDCCLVCEKAFDKNNKEMVQSWYVIVRKEKGQVNLYCPECWSRATGVIKRLQEEMNEEKF